LRARAIPARARCGFETYFQPGRNNDHWITEYWDGTRWVRIDSEILGFDIVDRPEDLAERQFLTGTEAWAAYRAGADPMTFGVHGTETIEKKDFITFTHFTDEAILAKAKNKPKAKVELSGITLDLNLEITPDALVEIIFDIKSGDIIRGRGNGDIKLQVDTKGEFNMFGQVEFTGQENQSNTILFDIQPAQKEGVLKLMADNKLKVNQVVPIITCRLNELKGKPTDILQTDTTDKIPNWALTREYRVTYRDSLTHSEELLKGELQHKKNGKDSIWVTISEGMEESLDVKLNDSLVFDVQGVLMKVRIAGIRKVDWPKDPPNFIFVFPKGVLENAPQIFVTATRINEQQQANAFQQQLVTQYPNVSLIDLRLILSTVNGLFDKLGLVIRFLALFSIITGLIVLAGAVINSKFLRIRENVLLRTIGARTWQITKITLIEYAWLGLFSALTGMILSLGGGWLLTKFFFEITFAFDAVELATIALGVVVLTVLIGWFNSREVISTPPLQVLRKEG